MSPSFDNRDGFLWMDGALVPWRDAKVHVLTHGLHYASSVFEGVRAYNGRIFKLNEHTERLIKSAEILGFSIPYSKEEINAACEQAVKTQGLKDAYIRPMAWRGSEQLGVSAPQAKIHLMVAAWEWPSYFSPEMRAKGIRVVTSSWRRPPAFSAPVHAKAAGLYMICTLSKEAAEAQGAQDALMLDYRGLVAETTSTNLFFIKDGAIHTPRPDCFLNGITRQTVIQLAKDMGIAVHEREISPDELGSFTEAFSTGTAAEITPIGQIDAHSYTPGRLTETLSSAYKKETGQ